MAHMKRRHFGDSLREHSADESVYLIYLDPPLNSLCDYNLLFDSPKGLESDALIMGFGEAVHSACRRSPGWRDQTKRASGYSRSDST